MRKIYMAAKYFKILFLLISFLMVAFWGNAQTIITSGSTVLASTIPVGNTVTINVGGTLSMNAVRSFASITTANAGTSTISGNSALTVTGNITITAGNTLSSTGTGTISCGGSLTTTGAGTATLSGRSITTVGTSGTEIFLSSASPTISGTSTLAIGTGTITIDFGKTLTLNTNCNGASLSTTTGLGATLTGSGTLTLTGAVIINASNSVNGQLIIGTNSTVICTSVVGGSGNNPKNITVNGILKNSGATTVSNGTLTFTCNSGSTVEYNGAAQTVFPTTYSNLTLSGSGAKTFPAGTTTVNAVLSIQGTSTTTVTGTLSYGGSSTLEYKGSAAQVTGNEFVSPFPGSGGVFINNASGVTLSSIKSVGTRPFTIGNTVPNSIFNDGGFQLTSTGTFNLVSGTFNIGNGVAATSYPGFGTSNISAGTTINYNSTSAQTIAAVSYANLSNVNGPRTFATSATIGISETFTPGSGVYTVGTSAVSFNGTASQSIPAFNYSFYNLFINNTAGISSIGSDLTITNTLTLTNGVVSTGATFKIIISNGASISKPTPTTGGWINGNFKQYIASVSGVTLHIGDAVSYSPVAINYATLGFTAGYLEAKVTVGLHSQISGSGLATGKIVTRYWSLLPSSVSGVAGTYDATFGFVAGDVPGGAVPGNFVIRKYLSPNWASTIAGIKTPTSTQATGLTGYGDFSIGEVSGPPTVSTPPSNVAVCLGNSTSITSATSSTPAPTVQWERYDGVSWVPVNAGTDGGIYTNFTTSTLNINTPGLSMNGYQYRTIYTNINGSVTSNAVTLTVTQLPTATIDYLTSPFANISAGPEAVTLTGTSGGTFSSDVNLTINSVTGAITPNTSTVGNHTIIYTIAAAGGCGVVTATKVINITTAPTANITYSATAYCISDITTHNVMLTGTGSYTGGTYNATPGLSMTAGGTITPNLSTAGLHTVTYTIPAGGGFPASTTDVNITITDPTTSFSYTGPFCSSDQSAQPVSTFSGITGGTFTPDANLVINTVTGAFTPNGSSTGSHTITYTTAATGGCAPVSVTTSISIVPRPVITLSYNNGNPLCQAKALTLPIVTPATSGTYSYVGSGLSLNTTTGAIDPSLSLAGDYDVTLTIPASGPCGIIQITTTVSIVATPGGNIDYALQPYCTSDPSKSAAFVGGTGLYLGGTFSSTPGLIINASTGAITPASSTPNTYLVTYAVPNACPVSFSTQVQIDGSPTATISYAGLPFCHSDNISKPVTFQPGDNTTGTFSAPGGLSIDPTFGDITPSASTAGTYLVTYTIVPASANCAPITKTTSVTITPEVGIPTAIGISSGTEPTCQLTNSTTTTTYTTTATAATSFNWTLSNPAAGSLNASSGVMTWTNSFSGSVDIQVTANGCNGLSAQVTKTVNIAPTVGIPTAITVDAGADPTCQITAATPSTTYGTTVTDGTGFNWSLSPAGAGSISSLGVATWTNGFSGSVVISVTASGCNGPSTPTTHSFTVTPTVGIPSTPTPSAATICQASVPTTYTTSASNATSYTWSVTGAGNIISGTGATATVTWAAGFTGSATVSVVANGCNGPSAPASTTVTVTPTVGIPSTPTPSATTICQASGPTAYTTSASNATSYIWSVTGAGNIISGTGATATVTWAAGFTGSATVSVVANGCNGPSTAASTSVTVTPTVGTPSTPTPSATTICQASGPTAYTTSASNATSYTWSVTGAGNTISGTGATATVIWSAGFSGSATVSVKANGCNGPSASASTTVTVTPTVGTPSTPTPSATTICQASGPTAYTTSASNATSYTWSVTGAGNTISGTGATATVIWSAGFSGSATVSVIANGCNGPSTAASTTVTVTPTVGIPSTPTPSATTICQASGPTAYTTSASNATSYTWSVTGAGNVISGTGATATVTWAAGFTGSATVSVVANGCNGPSTAASTTVTVNPTSVGGTSSSSQIICQGATPANIILAGYTGSIQWQMASDPGFTTNVSIITGATSATLPGATIGAISSTIYIRAIVQSGNCSSAFSTVVTVAVNPPFTPTIIATPSTICLGQSSILSTAGFSTADTLSGGDLGTLVPSPPGWTGAKPNASNNNTFADITWGVTNNGHSYGGNPYSSSTGSFIITSGNVTSILTTPSFSSVGRTGLSLQFYQGYNFTGLGNGKVEISINGGAWTTLVTYSGSTVPTNPFTSNPITTIPLNSYLGQPNIIIRFNFTGTGTNSTWAIDNVNVVGAYQPVTYSWTGPGFSGSGSSVTVTPTVPGLNTYSIQTTTGGCNPTTTSVSINVNPTPSITPQTVTTCSGSSFSVTPANGGGNTVPAGTTYTWSVPVISPASALTGGTAQATGQNSISQTLTNITTSAATATYTVTPTSGSGCTGASFTVTITVNPLPTAAFSSPSVTTCYGTTPTLTINGTPNASVVYNINGASQAPITLSATGSATITTGAITATTTYTITGATSASPAGCLISLNNTVSITVNSGSFMWTGNTNTDWNTISNWCSGTLPTSTSAVTIPSGVPNFPLISAGENAFAASVSVAGGASLTMSGSGNLTITNNGTFSNSGTFSASGTGAVIFAGTGTAAGTVSFNNVTINGAVDFGLTGVSTVTGSLIINAGGSVPVPTTHLITYGSSSSLIYNTGTATTVGNEWAKYASPGVAGVGLPNNVIIQNNSIVTIANLNTGAWSTDRSIAGNLNINSGSTFNLSSNFDLYIAGNWTNNGGFNANGRTVTFNGSGFIQTIVGTTTFYNITLQNPIGVSFGSSVTTVGNTFSNSVGTMDGGTSTVIFTGNVGFIIGSNSKYFYNLQINAGAIITHTTGGGDVHIDNSYTNNGTSYTEGPTYTTYFDKNSGTTSLSGSGSTTFGNVTIGQSGAIGAGTTLNANAHSFTVSGTYFTFNHSNSTFNGGSSTVTYNGSVDTIRTATNVAGTVAAFNGVTVLNNTTMGLDITVNGPLSIMSTTNKFAVNGHTLSLNGTVTGSGTLKGSSTSNIIVGTSGSAGTLYFDQTTDNITNVLKDFTVNGGATASLGNALYITAGPLPGTVTSNGTFNSGNYLTLRSDINGTSRVAASLGSINGNVTVERYIATGSVHPKSWQLLATPTVGQNVKDAWQEGATQTNVLSPAPLSAGNLKPGFGTMITSAVPNAATQVSAGGPGFDAYTAPGPSMKSYDYSTDTYDAGPSSTQNSIYNQKGYLVLVRGDRSVNTSAGAATPTILRTTGRLFTAVAGNTPPTTTIIAGKFESIGNPYASAVNIEKITKTGVDEFIYLWDPKLGGSYSLGAYVTFSYDAINNNYVPTPISPTYPGPITSIQSGQAFFMHNSNGANGTVSFSEAAKSAGSMLVTSPVRNPQPVSKLVTNLYSVNAGGVIINDGILNNFDNNYSNGIDGKDAMKNVNTNENLSIKVAGRLLAIERRQIPNAQDTIFLNLTGVRAQAYRFELIATNLDAEGLQGFLEDTYLNSKTPLNMNGSTMADFTIENIPGAYAPGRFRIVFAQSKVLPMTITDVKAYRQDKNINVEWKVENELNIKDYTVEKSVDSIHFITLTTVTATGNGANLISYQAVDEQPVSGYNYYRIRSNDKDGKAKTTQVVKVLIGTLKQAINIYPNPITDGMIHLQFMNEPAGKYGIRMLNKIGQVIVVKEITRMDGNSIELIKWDFNLAHGMYQLEVTTPDGTVKNINVLY